MNPDGFKKEGLVLTKDEPVSREARDLWSVRAAGSGKGIPYAWGATPEGAVAKLIETVEAFAKGVYDCIAKPTLVPEHVDPPKTAVEAQTEPAPELEDDWG